MATSTSGIEIQKSWKCFGGWVKVVKHTSTSTRGQMTFAVYLPPAAESGPVPVLYFLSGLTCTWENFMTKAGAQHWAAHHGIAIVCPDTSPRGHAAITGEADSWDFGLGAGFYVNATTERYSEHYRMYDYVTKELPRVLREHFPAVDTGRASICGHSMGGLGALMCALKNPGMYRSVSAFAPISHPSECPWGQKAFAGYLGGERAAWTEWDPTDLLATYTGPDLHVRIDQGRADEFYIKKQLLPEDFVAAAKARSIDVDARFHDDYDHSYYFVASFIGEHVAHHASFLTA